MNGNNVIKVFLKYADSNFIKDDMFSKNIKSENTIDNVKKRGVISMVQINPKFGLGRLGNAGKVQVSNAKPKVAQTKVEKLVVNVGDLNPKQGPNGLAYIDCNSDAEAQYQSMEDPDTYYGHNGRIYRGGVLIE